MTEPLLIDRQNDIPYHRRTWAFIDRPELVVKDISSNDSISAVLLIAESKIILQSAWTFNNCLKTQIAT